MRRFWSAGQAAKVAPKLAKIRDILPGFFWGLIAIKMMYQNVT